MFTTVHSTRVLGLSLGCALLLLLLPLLTNAQEVSSEPSTTTTPVQSTDSGRIGNYETDKITGNNTASGDFVVGPGKVDLTIKPGESQTVEMLVTNRTGKTRTFNLSVEDAAGSTDVNRPVVLLGDDRGPYSLKNYISFPYKHFELKQGERAHIPVTIKIPQNADPGGLYGSVLVDTVTVEERNATGTNPAPRSAIVARVGTLFFITVAGDIKHEGQLKKFSTIPEKSYFQKGPIDFGILFENTGPIHLAPYGEIRIKNMFGEEVGFIELDPWFALPQSLRLREVKWDRSFLFGRYTATAKINRSYDDVIDTATVSFWVVPWQWILGALLALFVIFFLLRAFFRRFEFRRKSN